MRAFELYSTVYASTRQAASLGAHFTLLQAWSPIPSHSKTNCHACRLEALYAAAHFLEPVIPVGAAAVFEKLGVRPTTIPRLSAAMDNLPPGTATLVGSVLYQDMIAGKQQINNPSDPSQARADLER